MKKLFHKLFNIREGETQRAMLMFSYVFLVISCLLIVKPVRNSLFVTRFGADHLPYVFMLVALIAALVSVYYSRIAQQVHLNVLIRYTLLFIISNLAVFWALLHFGYQSGWFIYAFYIWVALFAATATSQFWVLANYVFNAREAKRLFGFVGAGAISGGIFGGYLTNFMAPVIGTENLLLVCIVFMSICLLISQSVWKMRYQDYELDKRRRSQEAQRERKSQSSLQMLKNSSHLTTVAAIAGISVIVANLVDFQFNAIAEEYTYGKDELTAFFGFWLSTLSIISLFIQMFVTGRFLSRVGVGPSLFFLPLGILGGALTILFQPALWSAALIKVTEGSLKQSINKAGMELLILPVPASIKPQAKAFIDVFVDSVATGVGGLLLIICTTLLGFDAAQISLIIMALIVIWLVLIMRMRKEYVQAFRTAIDKRTIDLDEQQVNANDASMMESFVQLLSSDNPRQVIYGLRLLEDVKSDFLLPQFRKLLESDVSEIRATVLRMLIPYTAVDFSAEARAFLNDEDEGVRTGAINYLVQHSSGDNTIRVLKEFLADDDYQTRAAALICAASEISDNETLRKSLNLKELIDSILKELPHSAMSTEEQEFTRIHVAQAIGIARMEQLHPYLNILLSDESPAVVQAATESAGQTGAVEFIPVLISLLGKKSARAFARESLARYGELVLEPLQAQLLNRSRDRNIRLQIPRTVSNIGEQKSVAMLIKNLTVDDLLIRFEVIRSLNRLKKNFPRLKFVEKPIERTIVEEAGEYLRTLAVLYRQNETALQTNGSASKRIYDARALLIRAIEEKLDKNLERIFRLLGLRYMLKDMYNAYLGVVSSKQDVRANAVEFLDNVLDPGHKRLIIPIVENSSLNMMVESAHNRLNLRVPDEKTCLEELLANNDPWLTSCALHLIAESGDNSFYASVGQFVNSSNDVIRETAVYALGKLQ